MLRKGIVFFIGLVICINALAQPAACTEGICYIVGDSKSTVLKTLRLPEARKGYSCYFNSLVDVFKETKYGSGAKGCKTGYTLVNTKELDCVTFVEMMLALSITVNELNMDPHAIQDSLLFNEFTENLNCIRFYNCVYKKQEDRIHYFTDALNELEKNGYLKCVAVANGIPFQKKINYITTHKQSYAGIKDWNLVKNKELEMSSREVYWYPLDSLHLYSSIAIDGDVLALATNISGLDVSHCGFSKIQNGELFFVHAGQLAGKVVEQPLESYLKTRTTITGLFVYRPALD